MATICVSAGQRRPPSSPQVRPWSGFQRWYTITLYSYVIASPSLLLPAPLAVPASITDIRPERALLLHPEPEPTVRNFQMAPVAQPAAHLLPLPLYTADSLTHGVFPP